MTGVATAWAALVVYVTGVAFAFGVRSWQQWRTTGSTGFRGISGRPGSGAWWGGVLFVAALVLGLASPLLVITSVTEVPRLLARPALGVLGVVLAIAGLVFTLAAQRSMGTAWRIGVDDTERTELVERGLFGRIRNPIFTGMVAVSVGLVIAVPTAVALLSLVCLVVAVQLQVRLIEEPYLTNLHGAPYVVYRARTGRFLPRIGRGTSPGTGPVRQRRSASPSTDR